MSAPSRTEFKKLKSLATLKGRQKHGLFLAEGVRVLEEAARFNCWPQAVYYNEAALEKRSAGLVDTFKRAGCAVSEADKRDIDHLAESVTPQSIIAVFKMPDVTLDKHFSNSDRFILYLDNIADPGNVGTLIRSALAFGVNLVVLSPETVDPFNGKVIRSSAGTIFGQKLVVADVEELIKKTGQEALLLGAQKGGIPIGRALGAVQSGRRLIFAIGSEAHGLSAACMTRVNHLVGIAHDDKVESLNAAVAGSIILRDIYDKLHGVKNE